MMKRTKKLFISIASLSLVLNNVAYAATGVEKSSGGLPTIKYIFIGIAAIVIILLLFLGYKMDTNETDVNHATKLSNKAKKTKKKLSDKANIIKENSEKYEADNNNYESDGEIFDNEDFNETIEYKEDEDSLFSISEDEYEDEENEEEKLDDVKDSSEAFEEEEYEEDFDTSIIDKLDEKDEIETSNKSLEETMIFNNSNLSITDNSLEEEIDKLDDDKEIDFISNDNDDKFIEELKKFEEPKSDFEGFSVASKKEQKTEDYISDAKSNALSKEDKVENVVNTSNINNDFLSQMEANLQKDKEERDAKKSNKTTKKSTNKK